MSIKDAQAYADQTWKAAFVAGPYTAFVMLDYLKDRARLTWEDVLANGGPKKALKEVTAKNVIGSDRRLLAKTYCENTGRCTSFAIKVKLSLESRFPGVYDFQIYDLGRHRVARCANTGILIDSSALTGAFILPRGEWVRLEGSDGSWRWDEGTSKFQSGAGREMKSSKTIISVEDAMAKCLLELPSATSIPTLFRGVTGGSQQNAIFYGMVAWVWKAQRLELTPALDNRKHKLIAQFGGTKTEEGTEETNMKCIVHLAQFVKAYGGTHWERQWGSVAQVNEEIWVAACKVWGYPVLVIEG